VKRLLKFLKLLFVTAFIFINVLVAVHAYKFTHYSDEAKLLTKNPESLSWNQKIRAAILGVSLPRPKDTQTPMEKFETIVINNQLECWEIKVQKPKGIVLLFHGYGSSKSSVVGKSQILNHLGYSTVLVDFQGSGGSKGNTTSIGYFESQDVKTVFNYYRTRTDQPIFLCGTSMGAAAVMKCVSESQVTPKAIILECPFGSMNQTVKNRFEAMGFPSFPLAEMLVFYGGVMNGFWAFDHNPIDYARNIQVPTLLLCGGSDERVTQEEIDEIFKNLICPKQKIIYPKAKHESYLNEYRKEWTQDVSSFLKKSI
jgi:alpha-beta hydrolase superfamily lysophospholipase